MAKAKKSPVSPKVIIIIVIAIVALGLVAFFMMGKYKMAGGLSGSNAVTSIKDALTKSVSLKCEYTDPQNNKSVYFIKNGAIRADMIDSNPENSGSMILKDKKLYTWKDKEGYVMTLPEIKDAEGNVTSDSTQADDLIKDIEDYKDNCKPTVVSDSQFTPPSDVTFADMSKMMDGGSQMNEQDVNRMMQQYQDTGETERNQESSESTNEY